MVKLRIPIRAAAKERPRFAKGRAFMSKRYRDWQAEFKQHAQEQYRGEVITSPLRLSCTFSTPTGTIRPDIDNAAGACFDSLQPWLFANDRQIRELHVYTIRGEVGIEINVEVLP